MPYRICMVAVGKLPVPAVQGGASEALAQTLLDANEKNPQVEFTVLSVEHPDARKLGETYQHSKFVWFKPQVLWNKFWWKFRAAGKKLTGKELLFPYQRVQAAKWLKRHHKDFDYILTECDLDVIQAAEVPPEKVIYHLHWVGRPTAENDKLFAHLMPVSGYVGRGWAYTTGRSMDTVHVLQNCIAAHCFEQPEAEQVQRLRKSLGLADDTFVVLYVGRILEYKGVRELIRAVDALPNDNIALVLVGSTNFGLQTVDEYEQQVKLMADNSKKTMLFTGFVANEELGPFYAMADTVVMPSLCQEAAGLVSIEAMAAGRPVVATVSGGLPEYLTADCGILVPQDDELIPNLTEAIGRLYGDAELRRTMGEAGLARARQFSPEGYFERFWQIVKNLGSEPDAEETEA